MSNLSRSNHRHRSVRGQLESVEHMLVNLLKVFDGEALEPIRESAEYLRENPNDRETARDLADLLVQLSEELNDERQDLHYTRKEERDLLTYVLLAKNVAEALTDAYGDPEAELTLEHQTIDEHVLTERRKVSFMGSQNKRLMLRRARQRVDAMTGLVDQIVDELGGGRRAADTIKKNLAALRKLRLGDDSALGKIKTIQRHFTTYMRKYKVSKGVRDVVSYQFLELRKDLGHEFGGKVPKADVFSSVSARAGTGLDFWELGDEPEAPLEKEAPKKTGSISKALRDLGKTISIPGMSMRKTRDLLADPFGVA